MSTLFTHVHEAVEAAKIVAPVFVTGGTAVAAILNRRKVVVIIRNPFGHVSSGLELGVNGDYTDIPENGRVPVVTLRNARITIRCREPNRIVLLNLVGNRDEPKETIVCDLTRKSDRDFVIVIVEKLDA